MRSRHTAARLTSSDDVIVDKTTAPNSAALATGGRSGTAHHMEFAITEAIGPTMIGKLQEEISAFISGGGEAMVLAVDSDGGKVKPGIQFIDFVQAREREGFLVEVRIHNSASMATVVALSIGLYRTMDKNGALEFHRGTLSLEASDYILETGVIYPAVLSQAKEYNDLLLSILDKYGLSRDPKLMATLYGGDQLRLDAPTCLRLGLVHELF